MSEEVKPVGKMGHEALLELVMGQFSVMTERERERLLMEVRHHDYCTVCGKVGVHGVTCKRA